MEHKTLWNKVEKLCLELASEILEKETAPNNTELEAVKNYISIAKEIEWISLHWVVQSRCGVAVLPDQISQQQAVTRLNDCEKHSVVNAINQALSSAIHDTDEEVQS